MFAFKHRCQKRSDWMFTINHPIAVNITNKCGLVENTAGVDKQKTKYLHFINKHDTIVSN